MKLQLLKLLIVPAAAALLLASCATPANSSLLRDMEYGHVYEAPAVPELKIQRGDKLGVRVISETPALSAPFNDGAAEKGASGKIEYSVDSEGGIDFPVLGNIKVEGLTLRQCEKLISSKIQDSGYIKEPVVKVNLENFSVTIIGSAGNSVLNIEEDNINLIQVLARTGGVNAKSQIIKDVMVVRTEGGEQKAYSVNLQSRDLFDSPAFYLKQNDIVYVKPRGRSLNPTGESIMSVIQSTLSLGWIVSNVLYWYHR